MPVKRSTSHNKDNRDGQKPEHHVVQILPGPEHDWDSDDDYDRPRRLKRSASQYSHASRRSNITTTREVNVNTYQQRKIVAQGMLDIALFSANANQLRYVLESPDHSYFYTNIVLLSISLFLQILIGIGLVVGHQYEPETRKQIANGERIAFLTVIGIYIVTIVNVFIAAFGVGRVNFEESPYNNSTVT